MYPTSITIKLDFGAENNAGSTNNVSWQGEIPTPFGLHTGEIGQSEGALPPPIESLAQASGLPDQAPTPFSENLGSLADLNIPAPTRDMGVVKGSGKKTAPPGPEKMAGSSKKRSTKKRASGKS